MPSVSKKQHNLMAAVANNPKFAKKVGIPKSVGEEFMKADKTKKMSSGGSLPMVEKGGKKVPAFAADGVGKMRKGGMTCSTAAKKEVKSHEKRMHKMAKGGGIEMKGKTKGTMVKMNRGGSCK